MSASTVTLTRGQIGMKLDEMRMATAELQAISIRATNLYARLETLSGELYFGLLGEHAVDIEIMPQIRRSA